MTSRLPTWPTHVGKLFQQFSAFINPQRNPASHPGSVPFANVVANILEILNGGNRPTEIHQPGYRLSINART